MVLAVTGHRPDKLDGHDPGIFGHLVTFAAYQLLKLRQARVISGMALGWDQAIVVAAVRLRVPLVAAVPHDGQEAIWPAESRALYQRLLHLAVEVHIISPGPYEGWKMNTRNEWMVDHSDRLLALQDGSQGGTANCVRYARRLGRPIDNVWNAWKEFSP